MSGTVAIKTIIKRRVGWGDGTFAVGQSVEILDRMTTPDGWEVTGRQERPYFANVQFFGDTDPHDPRHLAAGHAPAEHRRRRDGTASVGLAKRIRS